MTRPRMSSLPLLQYCGQSQIVSATGGGGRNSAIGHAFHARCSGDEKAAEMALRLSDKERDTLDSLIPPTPITVNGAELHYAAAHKEQRVLMDESLQALNPDDEELAFLTGTVDLYWVVDASGQRTVYVADIKKSKYACPDGSASLQVVGYALAIASALSADYYYVGIWDATDGEWDWSECFDVWSSDHQLNVDRVLAAANNYGGEYNVGSHCHGCWGRSRCPQFLMPLELAEGMLEPFTRPEGLTSETALAAMLTAERVLETATRVKDLAKAYARDIDGLVDPAAGKVYAPVSCKGRANLDRSSLERDHPELVQSYTKYGSNYEQFKWLNINKKKPKAKEP